MRKISFAVIGGGPAAFYTSKLLLRLGCEPYVDIFEKQLCPFGLIRYGVAPDHISIKRSQLTLSQGVHHPHFRYFGNIQINSKSYIQLKKKYSGTVYAYGAAANHSPSWMHEKYSDKNSRIKYARELVYWYNGHPDKQHVYQNLKDVRNVAIIGNGNVAIDVARILLRKPNQLEQTQISKPALEQLKQCSIKNIQIIGRRGVTHSAFAVKQIRELHKLGFKLYAIQQQLEDSMTPASQIQCTALGDHFSSIVRMNKRKIDFIKQNFTIIPQKDLLKQKEKQFKKIIFRYLLNPKSVNNEALICNRTQLIGESFKQKSIPTEIDVRLNFDLLVISTGFQVTGIQQSHFDYGKKKIHNSDGCVVNNQGKVDIGNYAVGWCKTGPRGVLDQTLLGCQQTVNNIRIHIENNLLQEKIRPQQPQKYISFQDYVRLREYELQKGNKEKFIKKKLSSQEQLKFYDSLNTLRNK